MCEAVMELSQSAEPLVSIMFSSKDHNCFIVMKSIHLPPVASG